MPTPEQSLPLLKIISLLTSIILSILIFYYLSSSPPPASEPVRNITAELIRAERRHQRLLLVSCFKSDYYKDLLISVAAIVRIKPQCAPCDKPVVKFMPPKKSQRRKIYESVIESAVKATKKEEDDGRGTGVVWCVVGLLILSLAASIIDIMNTKKPQFKKTSSFDLAGKPGAAPRRCSLASLTAARHNRKHQFATKRASSIAEVPLPPSATCSTPPAAGMPILRAKFD